MPGQGAQLGGAELSALAWHIHLGSDVIASVYGLQ
jgi:hypothetical protein